MIKAIETRYKGYRFRSRLEARWAVFFDAARLEWEYEFEGYDLHDLGRYLPDFVMLHNPGRGPIVEIKPIEPTKTEMEKLASACAIARNGSGAYGAMIWGAPGKERWLSVHKDGFYCGDEKNANLVEYLGAYGVSKAEATTRHMVGIIAARAARFEHGEVPA